MSDHKNDAEVTEMKSAVDIAYETLREPDIDFNDDFKILAREFLRIVAAQSHATAQPETMKAAEEWANRLDECVEQSDGVNRAFLNSDVSEPIIRAIQANAIKSAEAELQDRMENHTDDNLQELNCRRIRLPDAELQGEKPTEHYKEKARSDWVDKFIIAINDREKINSLLFDYEDEVRLVIMDEIRRTIL